MFGWFIKGPVTSHLKVQFLKFYCQKENPFYCDGFLFKWKIIACGSAIAPSSLNLFKSSLWTSSTWVSRCLGSKSTSREFSIEFKACRTASSPIVWIKKSKPSPWPSMFCNCRMYLVNLVWKATFPFQNWHDSSFKSWKNTNFLFWWKNMFQQSTCFPQNILATAIETE